MVINTSFPRRSMRQEDLSIRTFDVSRAYFMTRWVRLMSGIEPIASGTLINFIALL